MTIVNGCKAGSLAFTFKLEAGRLVIQGEAINGPGRPTLDISPIFEGVLHHQICNKLLFKQS